MGAVFSRFRFTGYKVYNHHKENSLWALLWLLVFISSEFLGLGEANKTEFVYQQCIDVWPCYYWLFFCLFPLLSEDV